MDDGKDLEDLRHVFVWKRLPGVADMVHSCVCSCVDSSETCLYMPVCVWCVCLASTSLYVCSVRVSSLLIWVVCVYIAVRRGIGAGPR